MVEALLKRAVDAGSEVSDEEASKILKSLSGGFVVQCYSELSNLRIHSFPVMTMTWSLTLHHFICPVTQCLLIITSDHCDPVLDAHRCIDA